MIVIALVLLAQPIPPPPPGYVLDKPCPAEKCPWLKDPIVKPNPFDQFDPKPEQLGRGPHTLVISDGNAMMRVDYKSGPACQQARNKVQLQTDSRLTNTNPYVVYGSPRVTAFCVPR